MTIPDFRPDWFGNAKRRVWTRLAGVDPTSIGRHWAVPAKRSLPEWFSCPTGYDAMTVQERLDVLDRQGLVHWPDREGMPGFKRYLTAKSGAAIQDMVWTFGRCQRASKRASATPPRNQ